MDLVAKRNILNISISRLRPCSNIELTDTFREYHDNSSTCKKFLEKTNNLLTTSKNRVIEFVQH